MKCEIAVECADIVDFACDVLVLKFAQAFHGADAHAAILLKSPELENLSLRPGNFVLISSDEKLSAKKVLFIGVPTLKKFAYGQIRQFSGDAMRILAEDTPAAKHVAMTMHGIGYGLDEKESFLAQIGGLFDALNADTAPAGLEKVTIVERNYQRAKRLKQILADNLSANSGVNKQSSAERFVISPEIKSAGDQSNAKPHIFVAMPFSKEMEDVYRYGIQNPVNAAGYLCERVDMAVFTGDILDRIKTRIETSALVIADLSGSNPNVYLEVGYAWGKQRPTLLIAKCLDDLKFDVQGQRCIIYENISDLEDKLKVDLSNLK